jgi:membrane-associated phospholipid phosphatase
MKNKRFFIVCSAVFLLCFALLSKFEDRQFIRTIDFVATVKVQDRIDKSAHLRLATLVDNTMEGATFFASPEFSSIVILVLTGLVIYDRKNKKFRLKNLLIPALFVLIVLVELYGKTVIHHPSPPFSMIKHTTSVFPANYINEQFSYPSGHTARAVFLAMASWMVIKRKRLWMGIALGMYVGLVALSRIYLGHHWLSDVIGGGVLGAGLGGFIFLGFHPSDG